MSGFIGCVGFRDIALRRRAEMVCSAVVGDFDSNDIFKDERAVLGNCLFAANQSVKIKPFVDKESGLVLVLSGRIFNFRELRKQLQFHGHRFCTETESEVVIKAFVQWGKDSLTYFRGMFAFVVYNPKSQSVFFARDRLGVKPLFYFSTPDGCAFASTLAALLQFEWIERKIFLSAFSHYLTTTRILLGEKTLVQSVFALQPGEYGEWKQGENVTVRSYWQIPVVTSEDKLQIDFSAATKQVRELVFAAVEEQLESDVPIGGFLSGGLDSCVVAHIAQKKLGDSYRAYNVGYDAPGYNEWDFVRIAEREMGISCKISALEAADFVSVWKRLILLKGSPLITPNEVPIYELSRRFRQEFQVALSGEGADEIFGGYTLVQFAGFDFDRSKQQIRSEGPSEFDLALERAYGRYYFHSRMDQHFCINSWMPFVEKCNFLQPDIWSALKNDGAMFAWYEQLFGKFASCSTFDAYMHVHALVNLEALLSRVDSGTVAAGVEARVPFTDHRIVEYLFSLPDEYHIDWWTETGKETAKNMNIGEIVAAGLLESKKVLRRAFGNDLPKEIIERPKMSFPVPFLQWFDGIWKEMTDEALSEAEFLRPEFRSRVSGNFSTMSLWPLVNLVLWQRAWKMRF